jgi:hypothetical protein
MDPEFRPAREAPRVGRVIATLSRSRRRRSRWDGARRSPTDADLEIHLRAEQEQHRLGIDQQLDPLVLDHFVKGRSRLGQLHRIGHAGAAAVFHAHAHAHDRLVGG